MRNQLPAIVQKVICSEGRSLCSLECCGNRVFAEITPETRSEMRIQAGTALWMLFKSLSVNHRI
jgi:ABC-type molybdate transport system ATPase subunit